MTLQHAKIDQATRNLSWPRTPQAERIMESARTIFDAAGVPWDGSHMAAVLLGLNIALQAVPDTYQVPTGDPVGAAMIATMRVFSQAWRETTREVTR
jgi:hypothetical protein